MATGIQTQASGGTLLIVVGLALTAVYLGSARRDLPVEEGSSSAPIK
ncbi:MAG: hypothetical protein H7X97_10500 [Opitutaceae bacterium]|nr:hypothetical protein [Verrucomicrobiales bacterium]